MEWLSGTFAHAHGFWAILPINDAERIGLAKRFGNRKRPFSSKLSLMIDYFRK
jgi:hypothetical protein